MTRQLTKAAELDRDGDADEAEVGAVLRRSVAVVTSGAGLGSGLGIRLGACDDGGRADGGESAGKDGFGKHFDCLGWWMGNLND